jgi:tRNA (cmo5U34)-methyltransferase
VGRVGDDIETENAGWSFGGPVAERFDEHVARSVPFYWEGHELIARASDFFVSRGSVCYDLGCATGRLLRVLADRHRGKDVRFVGVDVEPDMVQVARRNCDEPGVEIQAGSILEVELEPSDLIVSYYVMQFIKPKSRQIAFDRVYQALNWGGAFFCFEKVRAPDARFQDLATALYQEHKLGQGYDPAEIVEKSRSLKGVLEPFSTEGNLGLLRRAGFVDIMTIFKYVCFEGFLAIK